MSHITIDGIYENMAISKHFDDKKIVPIVFSDGLTAARCHYTSNARELASHGFIIFLP